MSNNSIRDASKNIIKEVITRDNPWGHDDDDDAHIKRIDKRTM